MKKKYWISGLFIIIVFCLAFFLRFYQISKIPNGLYPDETAIGYNAYAILKTGNDEHGVHLPIYFQSFDDYKLPVYIYSTALAIQLFGATAFAVRVSSALFGSLAVVALYFLVWELSKKKYLALLASFFLAVNPWHVFFSRAGYEVNMATSFLVIGTLFFVMAIDRKNNFFLFFISVLSFLLSVYTYNVTRLIAPVLFIGLIALYYKKFVLESKKTFISILVLFFIGMIPFLISFIALQSAPGFAAQKDALLIGNDVKADIIQTRSYFVSLPHIVQILLFNYWFLVAWAYIKNLISFFSTSFFFITGANHPSENIAGGLGMFYYFEFPLIIIGN